MLPLNKSWYSKLLLLALLLGVAGGLAALVTAHITLSAIQTYVVSEREVKLQAK